MSADRIIFLLCAGLIIASGIMVVSTRRLIHAALWLVASLFGIAILYAILQAGFLAVIQVVVYIGAIAILFIFAIMLTRKELLDKGAQTRPVWWIPALLSLIILAGLSFIIIKQSSFLIAPKNIPAGLDTLRELGNALVSPQAFVLPFEVASILLVAALIGAVYIASGKQK